MKPKQQHKRTYTVGHAAVIPQPCYHGDQTDLIMDKIDTELFKLVKVPAADKKRLRLSKEQREILEGQGVEFDTGDESVCDRATLQESLAKLRANKSFDKATDEADTGVGSVDDAASDLDHELPPQIRGKAHIYSAMASESSEDEEQKGSYAEIDSDCAKQLDEKYKMIMKNKKGQSLKDLKVSEQGSVQTEDFEAKFRELCIPPIPKPPDPNVKKGAHTAESITDLESVVTEDIENEYRKTIIKSEQAVPGKSYPVYKVPQQAKCRKRVTLRKDASSATKQYSAKPPKGRTQKSSMSSAMVSQLAPAKKKKARSAPRLSHQTSDIESVQTEDFENHFQTMMVKQIANVPITNFDQFMVDSDLDTVRSQVIRDKFLTALRRTERDKSFGGDSDASTCTENENARIDAIVEQKIQEILRKVKQNSGDYSDMDSVRAFQGSPVFHHIREESEEEYEEDVDPPVYTRHTRSAKVKRSARSPKVHRRKTSPYDDLELGDEAQEIERQSAQIRKEMETEGWHSPDRLSPSPHRSRTPTLPRSTRSPSTRSPSTQAESDQSLKMRDELSKMQLNIIRSKQERQTVHQEMESLKEQLNDHKQEIKTSEKHVKEHRSKAEDARSELMLVEFKRDSARKEMERLQNELKKKKAELEQFADGEETTDGATSTDYSRLRDLKLSRVEVAKMISEKDELHSKLKKRESTERECQELEKQVSSAKECLIKEQKNLRQREEKYKEDVEALETKLTDTVSDRDSIQQKLTRLEARLKQVDSDKNEILREKRSEYEDLRTRLQEQIAQTKHDSSQELSELRKQLAEVTAHLTKSATQTAEKDEANMKLREQVVTLQTKLSEETERRTTLKEEAQEQQRALVQQKERELDIQRKKAEEDRNSSLDQLNQELERQNQMVLNQAEHRFTQEITDLQSQLTARELELEVIRDRLRQQEAMGKQLAEKIRSEANMRFRQLVQEERLKWEEEKEAEINRQLSSMRDEMEKTAKQLREELVAERQLVDNQLKQITQLKKEVEGVKLHNRQAIREKLAAFSHAKESADLHSEKQMDRIREQIEEETHRSMERLRETIRGNEGQIDTLKKENKELRTKEQEIQSSSDAQERIMLNEINDECRKIASVLGTTPRVVTFTSVNSTYATTGRGTKMPMRTAIATALNNLKASNEDLRNFIKEIKQDLESQKQNVKASEKARKDSLDVMKQKMQKEKLQALETLKDRLIKEHLEEVDKLHKSLGKGKTMHKALREKDSELREIQLNMKKWKNQTTEKMAGQFQEEMAHQMEKRLKEYKKQQREWEREKMTQQREVERLEKELSTRNTATNALNLSITNRKQNLTYGSPMKAMPPAADGEMSQSFKQLQGKVKQLQMENLSLKRNKLSSSTPDLQAALHAASFSETPKKEDFTVKQLEIQVQRAENRAKMAEDRVEKNESLLNQKLLEMSKLQSTLTQQTKELMQLERAYSQLQQKTSRPPSRTGLHR